MERDKKNKLIEMENKIGKRRGWEDMMLKIVAAVCILLSSTVYGKMLSKELEDRIVFLDKMRKYCIYMKNEMEYGMIPLSELFYRLSRRANGEMKQFFGDVAGKSEKADMDCFEEIWNQAVERELKNADWKLEDKKDFLEFGKQMGYLDKQMQVDNIQMYKGILEIRIEECRRQFLEKGKIYQMLGMMTGVATVIILI